MPQLYISDALIKTILAEYKLSPDGVHGLGHWARVLDYGQSIAERNGADKEIVALFAVFHDCKRQNEKRDKGHGKRGGDFAYSLEGKLISLGKERIELLRYACSLHTAGKIDGDITVRTCWDSDRLDLNRVGIKTNPGKLCTKEARHKDILLPALETAGNCIIPGIVNNWKKLLP